jgi:hypothetical protein
VAGRADPLSDGCHPSQPPRGGSTRAFVPVSVAEAFCRASEHAGEYVRLDWAGDWGLAAPSRMRRPTDELQSWVSALRWQESQSFRFKPLAHINLQEARAIKSQIKQTVLDCPEPERRVNLVNSRVCVGAYSKGRSSSKQLNGILWSTIGCSVTGQKSFVYPWVGTDFNPADHPTRNRKVSPPSPAPETLLRHYRDMPQPASGFVPSCTGCGTHTVAHRGVFRPSR